MFGARMAKGCTSGHGISGTSQLAASSWLFVPIFMLSGIAVFVLRMKDPTTARPFRVPLYPVLPLIFVLTCAYLLYSSITYAQSQNAAWIALAVMMSGVVVWFAMKWHQGRKLTAS